jgi:hypothetical protein
MRNAGDLDTATDLQSEAVQAARELRLPMTRDMFAMATDALEDVYSERFEAVCDEIRRAQPAKPGAPHKRGRR